MRFSVVLATVTLLLIAALLLLPVCVGCELFPQLASESARLPTSDRCVRLTYAIGKQHEAMPEHLLLTTKKSSSGYLARAGRSTESVTATWNFAGSDSIDVWSHHVWGIRLSLEEQNAGGRGIRYDDVPLLYALLGAVPDTMGVAVAPVDCSLVGVPLRSRDYSVD